MAEFFDTDQFERMTADFSAFVSEEMSEAEGFDASAFAAQTLDWSGYIEVMSAWMLSPSLWDYTVLRIAELPNLVYVELQERVSATGQGDDYTSANSLSVYEFNEDGKIVRLRLGVADVALRVWPISSPSSSG